MTVIYILFNGLIPALTVAVDGIDFADWESNVPNLDSRLVGYGIEHPQEGQSVSKCTRGVKCPNFHFTVLTMLKITPFPRTIDFFSST